MPNEEEAIDPYFVLNLQRELEEERNRSQQLAGAVQGRVMQEQQDSNQIQWELDFSEDLDRIYHLLRGDRKVEDAEGNFVYAEPTDNREKTFNEFGVQLIMNILRFYLNRNTVLSNYDNDLINVKVKQLTNEIIDLIYNRYEDMFLYKKFEEYAKEAGYKKDKPVSEADAKKISEAIKDELAEKIKMYPIIVNELKDTVHSAYLRALKGFTCVNNRTARSVTQTEPLGQQLGMQNKSKFRVMHPSTWV